MARAHCFLAVIAAYLLLNNRVFFTYSTGGRGIVPVLELLVVPIAAALLLLTERNYSPLLHLNTRRFRTFWAPYLALTIALPFSELYTTSTHSER